jgi:hypothetical protein
MAYDQKDADTYLADLKRKATVAMDMLDKARRDAQVWQNYYDGNQWTDAERRTLEVRGQPALAFNHVKPAVNAIIGIVERGRTDPKGWGRTPKDQDSAEVATDGLRYVSDVTRFQSKRRDCLKDFLVWGICAGVTEMAEGAEIGLRRIRPEEFFYDPYSRDTDFGDARYMGIAKWMDEQDAIDLYPDQADVIRRSFNYDQSASDTFRDRPKDGWAWVDARQRRIMCFEMYKRMGGPWEKCVFVSGGILESGPSPFLDSKTGQPRCAIIAQSAYVDIDNARYGIVRDMLGPQDAINKARSKAVHILNVAKLRVDPGVIDIDTVRQQWAKPDGIIEAREGQIEELGDRNLAPGHLELLRDAKEEMRRQSPTPGIVGRQGASQSGRAILAEQQAGLTEQAPLLAQFDDWTLRVYRAFWDAIKQFWNEPKWIRVTDDENAPRFVGLNVPQPTMDPMTGQPAMQVQNSPADMDVDIVIDSTPDTAVIQEEQFQRLAELVQAGMPIPPDVLIEASSLPKKRLLLDKLRQAQEQQAQQPNAAMQAEEAKAQMQMQIKQQELEMQMQAKGMDLERQDMADKAKTDRAMQLADLQFKYDVERMRLQADMEALKAEQAVEVERGKKQADLDFSLKAKQLDFDFAEAEKDRESERNGLIPVRMTPALEQMTRTMDGLGQNILRNVDVLGEAIKRMASPKRLVKDPLTGEKRVEVVMTDMSLEDALASLAAPRRVVRDPLTGEKRTEIVN